MSLSNHTAPLVVSPESAPSPPIPTAIAARGSRLPDALEVEHAEVERGASLSDGSCCARTVKSPTGLVIVAVIVGMLLGALAFPYSAEEPAKSVVLLLSKPGALWLKALKCIVLPMIVFAMIDAMIMMRSLPGAEHVAGAVMKWYTILPLVAGLQACLYATLIIVGGGAAGSEPASALSQVLSSNITTTGLPVEAPPSLLETLLGILENMVPKNLVQEMYNDNLLPVIVASLTFGLLVKDKDESGQKTQVIVVIDSMNAVVFRVIGGLMSVTPFAISSLVFSAVAKNGLEGLLSAQVLVLSTVVSLSSHFFIFYPTMIFFVGQRNPVRYMMNCAPAFMQALGTSSSAATIPASTKCAIEGNKIAPHIAKFVVSLGATIGMDGTAIYLITAVIFIGNLQGKVFFMGDYITVAIMAALSAAGSAPIPNASLFLLQVIAQSVGVTVRPVDFGVISAVDWALDRLRTTVNVAGDQTVSAMMDRQFGTGLMAEKDAETGEEDEKFETFVQDLNRKTTMMSSMQFP